MLILALSDIHNAYSDAEKILSKEKDYDLILVCGDITTFGSAPDARKVIERFQAYGRPLLSISGNMDSAGIDEVLVEMDCSIDGKGKIIGDIGFFGVSAAPISELRTPYERAEEEIFEKATAGWKDIEGSKCRVFVPHSPPFNSKLDVIHSGRNVGSKSVRKFIDLYQPEIVACGHIHEARGIDMLGKSQMINCGSVAEGYYAVIEIGQSIRLENRK
jgi:uncharacterized protein